MNTTTLSAQVESESLDAFAFDVAESAWFQRNATQMTQAGFFGSSSDDVDNNDPEQLAVISLYEAMVAIPFAT